MTIDVLKKKVLERNPEQKFIIDNALLVTKSGSHLYGTATEQSDLDIRGIFYAPLPFWIGSRSIEHWDSPNEECDYFLWEIHKFLREIIRVSPNTVELLYVPDESMIQCNPYWKEILPEIKSLVNQSAYQAYKGYSTAQLRKMVTKHSNKTGRRDIVEEFGFDLKFVAHGFRLARQGIQLLTEGYIQFPRPDAEELKAIRAGEVYKGEGSIERCLSDWEREISFLDDALVKSVLPKKADFNNYESLLLKIFEDKVYGKIHNI